MTETEKAQLKADVEQIATENNLTMLQTISFLQTGAAAIEDEELLEALCELKRNYYPPEYR